MLTRNTTITVDKQVIIIPEIQKRRKNKLEPNISLMSHAFKTILNIIHSHIYIKLEEPISEIQFVLRAYLGTVEALLCVQYQERRASWFLG